MSIEQYNKSSQTQTHSTETETQTSTSTCMRTASISTETQTVWNTRETSSQTVFDGVDCSTQIEQQQQHNVNTQHLQSLHENVGLQTDLAGIQHRLKMYVRGLETAVQVAVTTSDSVIQVSPETVSIFTQTDWVTKQRVDIVNTSSQTHAHVSDIHTQTSTVLEPIFVDTSSQTHSHVSDVHTQADIIQTQLVSSGGNDLEGQVVALQAAVEGLQNQLISEREDHKRRQMDLERGWRHMRRSLHDSQVS